MQFKSEPDKVMQLSTKPSQNLRSC